MNRASVLAQVLRKFTDSGKSMGLSPAESKELLVWCLDLTPLEWDTWRN